MKFFNWLTNRFLIGGLMLSSICMLLALVIQFVYIVFGTNTHYKSKTKDGLNWSFGFKYKDGIEIPIRVNSSNFSDSSFYYSTKNGSSGGFTNAFESKKIELKPNDSIKYMDTITGNYTLNYWNSHKSQEVTNFFIKTFTVKVKPTSALQRFKLLIPGLLICLFLSYALWNLARFLQDVQHGYIFNPLNYKRLRNIGISFLLLGLIMLIFDFFLANFSVGINFESTIKNWRSPFYASGSLENNFSFSYLAIGLIFLILSSAFNQGNTLQQDKDLTI